MVFLIIQLKKYINYIYFFFQYKIQGRVWLVRRKKTKDYYAMKIINFAEKVINIISLFLKVKNKYILLLIKNKDE